MQEPILPIHPVPPIQEIDLLLAAVAAEGGPPQEEAFASRPLDRAAAVTGALRFLGVPAAREDAEAALDGRAGRWSPGDLEHGLARGLGAALALVEARCGGGTPPDGALVFEAWRELAGFLPGSRTPALRTADPRDALAWLSYPAGPALPGLLARFREEEAYLDFPALFRALHPVRRSFRIFHRLARLAPFRDHNLAAAWLAAAGYLLAKGYPLLVLEASDRIPVRQILFGAPPREFPVWERRLLAAAREIAAPVLRRGTGGEESKTAAT